MGAVAEWVRALHRCQHYRFRAYIQAFLEPSRFSLKMSHLGKNAFYVALLSVKWNSDDSATSFQCSAKLIRSAKVYNCVCFACLRLSPGRVGPGISL